MREELNLWRGCNFLEKGTGQKLDIATTQWHNIIAIIKQVLNWANYAKNIYSTECFLVEKLEIKWMGNHFKTSRIEIKKFMDHKIPVTATSCWRHELLKSVHDSDGRFLAWIILSRSGLAALHCTVFVD
jgi:hypothetical protein